MRKDNFVIRSKPFGSKPEKKWVQENKWFIVNLRYSGLGYNRGLESVVNCPPIYPPLSLAEIFAAVGD